MVVADGEAVVQELVVDGEAEVQELVVDGEVDLVEEGAVKEEEEVNILIYCIPH